MHTHTHIKQILLKFEPAFFGKSFFDTTVENRVLKKRRKKERKENPLKLARNKKKPESSLKIQSNLFSFLLFLCTIPLCTNRSKKWQLTFVVQIFSFIVFTVYSQITVVKLTPAVSVRIKK